ncbi:uncharacterized protein BT62DRAFT_315891 [Guyanagaster necrorhizus]|uniref:Uncharacterized protein n=1 Tax=Guyanagaster necrorhizus TaxID=856835 RepID=A0A9P8AQG0_9AGAR|nr:uncharacterized protein BT62DRAFT_315891 [Guyanagaster necrorhizus MCA 3950]KAG7443811.1 hypothetical protein BT62DRAFT_315891 [Guyanagaster necrorhizus MCA 3950]
MRSTTNLLMILALNIICCETQRNHYLSGKRRISPAKKSCFYDNLYHGSFTSKVLIQQTDSANPSLVDPYLEDRDEYIIHSPMTVKVNLLVIEEQVNYYHGHISIKIGQC